MSTVAPPKIDEVARTYDKGDRRRLSENNSVSVEFDRVSKRLGSAQANDEISFKVRPGTIHALLGENGAGKTTLMKLLAGLLQPDAGSIRLDGRPVRFRGPRDARRHGIAMAHQHLSVIPALTVAENLLLDDDHAPFLLRHADYGKALRKHTERFNVVLDPHRPVSQLSFAERQVLEMCRLLLRNCEILILDEPTSLLSPVESDALLEQVKALARAGLTVLLVTHKLREIERYADDVTVLRKGRCVLSAPRNETTHDRLTAAMVGSPVGQAACKTTPPTKAKRRDSQPVLELTAVRVVTSGAKSQLCDVSLQLTAGEVLGVAGISGNGQEELARIAAGLAQPSAGHVRRDTKPTEFVAYVPADRIGLGAPLPLTVAENLVLREYRQSPISVRGVVNWARLKALAEHRRSVYNISASSLDAPTAQLSGGNIQRLVLARELSRPVKLLVAHNPTAGLDVQGTDFVRQRISAAAAEGAGVLLLSEDLDELFELADTLVVLNNGRCSTKVRIDETDRDSVGKLMTGATPLGEGC